MKDSHTANISQESVKYIAKLANLSLTPAGITQFAQSLSAVLDLVSKIQSIDTAKVEPTSQVTGLTNITREDVVDKKRILTQKEALKNARRTHNGFFVVDAIFK